MRLLSLGTEKTRNPRAEQLVGTAAKRGPGRHWLLACLLPEWKTKEEAAKTFSGRRVLGTLPGGAVEEPPARGELAALPADPPATTCREVSRSQLTLEDIFAAGGPGGRVARASSPEGGCMWRPAGSVHGRSSSPSYRGPAIDSSGTGLAARSPEGSELAPCSQSLSFPPGAGGEHWQLGVG